MTSSYLPPKIFEEQSFTQDSSVLVIGINQALINHLPAGFITIDPSISKVKMAMATYPTGSFQTQNLATFTLDKSFSTILSLNTLHLTKDLDKIFLQIQKHLAGEATLYFPLSPNSSITHFLENTKWKQSDDSSSLFQKRSRADIEDAVLSAPFKSVLIEEKQEHQHFYSRSQLLVALQGELSTLTNLTDAALVECANELLEVLYKSQSKDAVLTMSSPWILLTLSNELE